MIVYILHQCTCSRTRNLVIIFKQLWFRVIVSFQPHTSHLPFVSTKFIQTLSSDVKLRFNTMYILRIFYLLSHIETFWTCLSGYVVRPRSDHWFRIVRFIERLNLTKSTSLLIPNPSEDALACLILSNSEMIVYLVGGIKSGFSGWYLHPLVIENAVFLRLQGIL